MCVSMIALIVAQALSTGREIREASHWRPHMRPPSYERMIRLQAWAEAANAKEGRPRHPWDVRTIPGDPLYRRARTRHRRHVHVK